MSIWQREANSLEDVRLEMGVTRALALVLPLYFFLQVHATYPKVIIIIYCFFQRKRKKKEKEEKKVT